MPIPLNIHNGCIIRFATPLITFGAHWYRDLNHDRIIRTIKNCPGKPECPLCKRNDRCINRYAAYCIDQIDNQFKIFEFGRQLYEEFEDFYNPRKNKRVLGDCNNDFWWSIKKYGDGMRTRYSTYPTLSVPTKLPDELSAMALQYKDSLIEMYPKLDRQDVFDLMEGKTLRDKNKIIAPKRTRWQALEIR